ncbi:Apc13p protein [Popillia japonica]|uniref:Anaphase-promoting complex subunit 13 n=1 Tax=Popillia japonica TaxID=7064 RepID=A0AAW1K201_POPJA
MLMLNYSFQQMDSQVTIEGYLVDLVDDDWRADKLPEDDITVPLYELPDPEADSGDVNLTLKEQEQLWTDIALPSLNELQ